MIATDQRAAQEDKAVEASLYRAIHFAYSLENVLELEAQDLRVTELHHCAKALRQDITAQLAEVLARREVVRGAS